MPIDILVFGPHPDDAGIGQGGSIALHADAGYTVGICDLTVGELSANGTPEQRRREAEAAARALGAAWRENLGWPDGGISASPDAVRSAIDIIQLIVHARLPCPTGTIGIRTTWPPAKHSARRRSRAGSGAMRPPNRRGRSTGFAITSSTTSRRRRSSSTCRAHYD